MAESKKEVLVVASKIKQYIKSKSGLLTSASVIDALSEKVRQICDAACERAKADKRKTVKDRDVQ